MLISLKKVKHKTIFFFFKYKMGKEIITFEDIRILKDGFLSYKDPIFLNYVDIGNINI